MFTLATQTTMLTSVKIQAPFKTFIMIWVIMSVDKISLLKFKYDVGRETYLHIKNLRRLNLKQDDIESDNIISFVQERLQRSKPFKNTTV